MTDGIVKVSSAIAQFEQSIEWAIEQARKGDLDPVTDALDMLSRIGNYSGLKKAEILYSLRESGVFENQDAFMDYASQFLDRYNVIRYIRVIEHLGEMRKFIPEIETVSIGKLIPVATAIDKGIEFTKDDGKVIYGGTVGDVLALIREKKGQDPKQTSVFVLYRNGDIVSPSGRIIGRLFVDDEVIRDEVDDFINRSHLVTV